MQLLSHTGHISHVQSTHVAGGYRLGQCRKFCSALDEIISKVSSASDILLVLLPRSWYWSDLLTGNFRDFPTFFDHILNFF